MTSSRNVSTSSRNVSKFIYFTITEKEKKTNRNKTKTGKKNK